MRFVASSFNNVLHKIELLDHFFGMILQEYLQIFFANLLLSF